MKAKMYIHYRPFFLFSEAIKSNMNKNVKINKLVDYIFSLVKDNEKNDIQLTSVKFFNGALPSKALENDPLRYDRTAMEIVWTAGYELYNFPLYPKNGSYTERGVDVALACHAIQDACERKVDVAILFVTDTDYTPLVTQLKSLGVIVYVVVIDVFNIHTAAPLKRASDCLIELGESVMDSDYVVDEVTRKD